MTEVNYIFIDDLLSTYQVSHEQFDRFVRNGLVNVHVFDNRECIYQHELSELLTMFRLYNDLDVNVDAIDIIVNMRRQMINLYREVDYLRNKIHRMEADKAYRMLDIPGSRGMIIEITEE